MRRTTLTLSTVALAALLGSCSGANTGRSRGPAGNCTLPASSVVTCASVQGYHFALPLGQTCPADSRLVGTVPLTCADVDHPAFHACVAANGDWQTAEGWVRCDSLGLTDAPGDFLPQGESPVGFLQVRHLPSRDPAPPITAPLPQATQAPAPSEEAAPTGHHRHHHGAHHGHSAHHGHGAHAGHHAHHRHASELAPAPP